MIPAAVLTSRRVAILGAKLLLLHAVAAAEGLPTGPTGLALSTPSSSSHQPRAEKRDFAQASESVLNQGCTFFLVRRESQPASTPPACEDFTLVEIVSAFPL